MDKKIVIGIVFVCSLICSVCVLKINVWAVGSLMADRKEVSGLVEELQTEQIDQILDELLENNVSFSEIMERLITGDLDFSSLSLKELFISLVMQTFQKSKTAMLSILLLGILSAVFSNIADAFETKGSAQISL